MKFLNRMVCHSKTSFVCVFVKMNKTKAGRKNG